MKVSMYTPLPGLGSIKITASERGVTSIRFVKKGTNKKSYIAHGNSRADNSFLITAERELRLYAQGKLKHFSVPVDIRHVSGFTRRVLEAVKKIPYGKVLTYKQVALLIGNIKAVRAVGNSLGKNPVPIIIPCHRVIRSDKTLGGFSSGIEIKKRLLAIEQANSAAL